MKFPLLKNFIKKFLTQFLLSFTFYISITEKSSKVIFLSLTDLILKEGLSKFVRPDLHLDLKDLYLEGNCILYQHQNYFSFLLSFSLYFLCFNLSNIYWSKLKCQQHQTFGFDRFHKISNFKILLKIFQKSL